MTKPHEHLTIEPQVTADSSIIWLHGLGAHGKDFVGIVDQLGLPKAHAVRFIFPNAPFINVTINQGMRMRGWYDIEDLSMLHREDVKGIQASQASINDLIQHEIASGIAGERIILAGFSQGGAMSLYTVPRYPQKLGGIIVLSAYMLVADRFTQERQAANKNTPIFMAHGIFDPVVPYSMGQAAHALLVKCAYPVEWYSYPMIHTLCLEEITAIGAFIRRCLDYA